MVIFGFTLRAWGNNTTRVIFQDTINVTDSVLNLILILYKKYSGNLCILAGVKLLIHFNINHLSRLMSHGLITLTKAAELLYAKIKSFVSV